jgi:AcrR family transcriptional regulator
MARPSRRTVILDDTEDLARTVGLVRVTTKAVAAAAGCSEASIYYHFADRSDLLAEMVAGRFRAAQCPGGPSAPRRR